jgi:5-methylcytosine-specific restriction endonuclease McrA
MTTIPARLRRLVIDRAGNRCEYCHLSQQGQEATFHVDHVRPVVAGGPTESANLALACVSCSLRKGARTVAHDHLTRVETPLFNPREHLWADHFAWNDVKLMGLTSIGRATIDALQLNRPLILLIREEEAAVRRHPIP